MTETGPDPLTPPDRVGAGDKPQRPVRFYKSVAVVETAGGYAVALDAKIVRTPGRAPLAVARRSIAEALAAEWDAQGSHIEAMTMPLTRLANSAIDGVAGREGEVRKDIVAYAGSDLLVYRADSPEALAARQEELWGPLVGWARRVLGAPLQLAAGVMPINQAPGTLSAIADALEPLDGLRLAAAHVVTTLTGSAVIALAVAFGAIDAETGWRAAHVDEDWEIALWGEDAEASARRAARWRDMQAAARVLAMLRVD